MSHTGGYGPLDFPLSNFRIKDRLPIEIFITGDLVCCPAAAKLGSGRIIEIDPDGRLAKVDWDNGRIGWWYLVELQRVQRSDPIHKGRRIV